MTQAVSNRWWVVVAGGCAFFMAMLDSSIVGVALPFIGAALHATPASTQWAVLGYLLALVALIVPTGRWLDGVGRRAAMLTGTAGFAVTSVAAGLAPSVGVLVAARVAQGCFGALLFALVPALVATAVRPEERSRAMGFLGVFGPLGAVSGPVVGGFLVGRFGWPAIFLVNVPISVVVAGLTVLAVPAGARVRLPGRRWLTEVVLFGGAVLCVMLAVTFGPGADPRWFLLVVPAAPLVALWSRLPASGPVLAALRVRGNPALVVSRCLVLTSACVPPFLVPYFLQREAHQPATVVGATLLGMTVAMVVCGPAGGYLADRYGAHRVSLVGVAVLATGVGLLTGLEPAWTPLQLAWRLVLVGAGLALFSAPNQALLVGAAPAGLTGAASAVSGLAQNLGFAFGPALASGVWALSGYHLTGMRVGFGAATVCALVAIAAGLSARTDPGRPAAAPVPTTTTKGKPDAVQNSGQ
jgi:MFS transporter, DHA2 family, multidrug resistance protein